MFSKYKNGIVLFPHLNIFGYSIKYSDLTKRQILEDVI